MAKKESTAGSRASGEDPRVPKPAPPPPAPQLDKLHQPNTVNRKDRKAVFDERVPVGTDSAELAMLTSVAHNSSLGKYNRLALEVVLDDIRAATSDAHLYLFVEHSSDGTWWLQRTNQDNTFDPSNADVDLLIVGSSPGPATVIARSVWCDAAEGKTATGPLLTYVRLRVFFTDQAVEGHLRIYATSHDGTPAPSRAGTQSAGAP